ncbi:MAG: mccF [Alphaproteobacteria bacterium]|nr:mccF [Alphaproteobacteria bacterium]
MKHLFLIAPSSAIPAEKVLLMQSYFEPLGRKVTVPPDLFGEDLLCANTDALRFKHLKDALVSEADEIMMIIGGYGLTRLMPELLSLEKPRKVKTLYGFSDATALHIFLNQVWDWPSVHGPVGLQLSEQRVDVDSIERTLRILKDGLSAYSLPELIPLNALAQDIKTVSGKVVGGNLCLIQTSLGTPWQLKAFEVSHRPHAHAPSASGNLYRRQSGLAGGFYQRGGGGWVNACWGGPSSVCSGSVLSCLSIAWVWPWDAKLSNTV